MAVTGKGRRIRSEWVYCNTSLRKPILFQGDNNAISIALNDFFFGRTTTVELRMWDGTQWVEPTHFQKALSLTSTYWAAPVPETLSAAVNRLASAVYALRGSSPIP